MDLSQALQRTYFPDISHWHYFARAGDLEGLKRVSMSKRDTLLYQSAPRDESNRCPMFVAVENGQLECAQFLFELYSHDCLTATNRDNSNLLMAACKKGNLEMLLWLHSVTTKNSDLLRLWGGVDKRRRTCLSLACESGNLECAEIVCHILKSLNCLEHYISMPNEQNQTPFQVALDHPRFQTCWFLLIRGGLRIRPFIQLDNEADRSIFVNFAKTIAFDSPFDYPDMAAKSLSSSFCPYMEFLRCSIREGCVVSSLNTDVLRYIGVFLGVDVTEWRRAARKCYGVLGHATHYQ
jgi:hypothetical protein